MSSTVVEALFIVVLILANAVFAMSETAIISARKARLQQRANEGDSRARTALELANTPNTFLAMTQVGMTLVGVLAGAFGGATIADALAAEMRTVPWLVPHATGLSLAIVVFIITYLQLIIGELVPKQLALNSPEQIASLVAVPMRAVSRPAAFLIHFLSASTNLVLRLIGARTSDEPAVTEEEIKVMIDQGTQTGTFQRVERDMVGRVFRLGDLRIGALMTPRTEVTWLDIHDAPDVVRRKIAESGFSRYPVAQGSLDNVLGVVRAKDLLRSALSGHAFELKTCMVPPLFVPEKTSVLRVLELFKETGNHIALIIDEFGGFQGLVTINSVMEEVVGDVVQLHEEPDAIQRADGSWLLDGMLPIDRLRDILSIKKLPGEDEGDYQTLGGFVMAQIGRIPISSDHFETLGLRFEVVDMDGHRVDKVMVSPAQPVPIPPTDAGQN